MRKSEGKYYHYASNTVIYFFFLEGDTLTATDIVTREIITLRLVGALNVRPYRLPYAYQEEELFRKKSF